MKAVSPLTKRLAKLLLVLLLIFFVTPVVFGAVEEPAPLSVDPIACTTGTTISGTVYQADGSTPLSGATISFRDFTTDGELYTATTDGSGNYSCDPAVGNYRIYAEGGGYHRTYYSAADYENATNVTVIVSTMLTGVDFVLDTPVNIPEHLLFNSQTNRCRAGCPAGDCIWYRPRADDRRDLAIFTCQPFHYDLTVLGIYFRWCPPVCLQSDHGSESPHCGWLGGYKR